MRGSYASSDNDDDEEESSESGGSTPPLPPALVALLVFDGGVVARNVLLPLAIVRLLAGRRIGFFGLVPAVGGELLYIELPVEPKGVFRREPLGNNRVPRVDRGEH